MLKMPTLMRLVRGRILPQWDNDLRLPKHLDRVVAYLFKDRSAAEDGNCDRAATAFWVGAETAQGTVLYLVTNRHVVEDGTTTVRVMDDQGQPAIIESSEADWIFHTDPNIDLAIAQIEPSDECNITMFGAPKFVSQADVEALDMAMGDDVCMVGRHLNYDGKLTNLPTSRFGHLVQLPGDLITDERKRSYSAFLVQILSLPGFSGSPVFLVQNDAEKNLERGMGSMVTRRYARLLGVNCGHIPSYSPTYLAENSRRNPDLTAETNSGVSSVIPAWKLMELIDGDLAQRP